MEIGSAMRRALILSALLHVLLLAIPQTDYSAASEGRRSGVPSLVATLKSKSIDKAAATVLGAHGSSPVLPRAEIGSTPKTTGVLGELFRLTAGNPPPSPVVSVATSAVPAIKGRDEDSLILKSAISDLEGTREYRLLLARAARQITHSQVLANQSRWQGEIVLAISKAPGAGVPNVSVAAGSGQSSVDEQTLRLMEQAVRAASLPDSLRGEKFVILLPVHFYIEK